MIITLLIIFVLSLIMAIYSMRDFDVPDSVKKLISRKNAKGTIVFLKKKIIHYSSGSSSFSSGS